MGHWADGTRVAIETATKGEGGAREAEDEDPGPGGHVRPSGHPRHRNPSTSYIHPRNRTRMGNVSLATDDAT